MTKEKTSRKQEILDAALACFTEHGVEAATIDMIRERSGASVGSLYHHFGSKERIAVALYVAVLEEYGAYQAGLLQQAGNAEDGIKAIVYSYVDWVSANPDKARFVLYSRSMLAKSAAADELQERTRHFVPEVLDWARQYIDSGAMKDLPTECYPALIVGPAQHYARLWLSGRAKRNIRFHREIFAEAAWNAVKP